MLRTVSPSFLAEVLTRKTRAKDSHGSASPRAHSASAASASALAPLSTLQTSASKAIAAAAQGTSAATDDSHRHHRSKSSRSKHSRKDTAGARGTAAQPQPFSSLSPQPIETPPKQTSMSNPKPLLRAAVPAADKEKNTDDNDDEDEENAEDDNKERADLDEKLRKALAAAEVNVSVAEVALEGVEFEVAAARAALRGGCTRITRSSSRSSRSNEGVGINGAETGDEEGDGDSDSDGVETGDEGQELEGGWAPHQRPNRVVIRGVTDDGIVNERLISHKKREKHRKDSVNENANATIARLDATRTALADPSSACAPSAYVTREDRVYLMRNFAKLRGALKPFDVLSLSVQTRGARVALHRAFPSDEKGAAVWQVLGNRPIDNDADANTFEEAADIHVAGVPPTQAAGAGQAVDVTIMGRQQVEDLQQNNTQRHVAALQYEFDALTVLRTSKFLARRLHLNGMNMARRGVFANSPQCCRINDVLGVVCGRVLTERQFRELYCNTTDPPDHRFLTQQRAPEVGVSVLYPHPLDIPRLINLKTVNGDVIKRLLQHPRARLDRLILEPVFPNNHADQRKQLYDDRGLEKDIGSRSWKTELARTECPDGFFNNSAWIRDTWNMHFGTVPNIYITNVGNIARSKAVVTIKSLGINSDVANVESKKSAWQVADAAAAPKPIGAVVDEEEVVPDADGQIQQNPVGSVADELVTEYAHDLHYYQRNGYFPPNLAQIRRIEAAQIELARTAIAAATQDLSELWLLLVNGRDDARDLADLGEDVEGLLSRLREDHNADAGNVEKKFENIKSKEIADTVAVACTGKDLAAVDDDDEEEDKVERPVLQDLQGTYTIAKTTKAMGWFLDDLRQGIPCYYWILLRLGALREAIDMASATVEYDDAEDAHEASIDVQGRADDGASAADKARAQACSRRASERAAALLASDRSPLREIESLREELRVLDLAKKAVCPHGYLASDRQGAPDARMKEMDDIYGPRGRETLQCFLNELDLAASALDMFPKTKGFKRFYGYLYRPRVRRARGAGAGHDGDVGQLHVKPLLIRNTLGKWTFQLAEEKALRAEFPSEADKDFLDQLLQESENTWKWGKRWNNADMQQARAHGTDIEIENCDGLEVNVDEADQLVDHEALALHCAVPSYKNIRAQAAVPRLMNQQQTRKTYALPVVLESIKAHRAVRVGAEFVAKMELTSNPMDTPPSIRAMADDAERIKRVQQYIGSLYSGRADDAYKFGKLFERGYQLDDPLSGRQAEARQWPLCHRRSDGTLPNEDYLLSNFNPTDADTEEERETPKAYMERIVKEAGDERLFDLMEIEDAGTTKEQRRVGFGALPATTYTHHLGAQAANGAEVDPHDGDDGGDGDNGYEIGPDYDAADDAVDDAVDDDEDGEDDDDSDNDDEATAVERRRAAAAVEAERRRAAAEAAAAVEAERRRAAAEAAAAVDAVDAAQRDALEKFKVVRTSEDVYQAIRLKKAEERKAEAFHNDELKGLLRLIQGNDDTMKASKLQQQIMHVLSRESAKAAINLIIKSVNTTMENMEHACTFLGQTCSRFIDDHIPSHDNLTDAKNLVVEANKMPVGCLLKSKAEVQNCISEIEAVKEKLAQIISTDVITRTSVAEFVLQLAQQRLTRLQPILGEILDSIVPLKGFEGFDEIYEALHVRNTETNTEIELILKNVAVYEGVIRDVENIQESIDDLEAKLQSSASQSTEAEDAASGSGSESESSDEEANEDGDVPTPNLQQGFYPVETFNGFGASPQAQQEALKHL